MRALTRGALPTPEVRIVHLGLGAFHRAHQAWYTSRLDDWGIAAFTGRGPEAARALRAQDCVYTLVEREADGDRAEVIGSIVEAYDASETAVLRDLVSRPAVTVVTLTVTEKGYRLDGARMLDVGDPDVIADVATLSAAPPEGSIPDGVLRTMPGRLAWALEGRRQAKAGPIAVISCDNLSGNGAASRASVHGLALRVDVELAAWIDENVDWIDTSIDRITPRTTDADIRAVGELTGFHDLAPVITERSSSWIISGNFRAERPRWEDAGVRFVDDLEPFEHRKLWMLNGAHSLLAYSGIARDHATVASAVADPECAALMHALWDLNVRHLRASGTELDLEAYRATLEERFRNTAIAHHLRQIAADGSVKLRSRVVDVVCRDRAVGCTGEAGLRVIAAWMSFVQAEISAGRTVEDADAATIAAAVASVDPVARLTAIVSVELAEDLDVVEQLREFTAG